MPRVGLVGCGDVSVVHLEAIAAIEDAELVAVCDTDDAVRDAAADRWGVPGYADHREMISRERPDVVHVSTPHDQHVPVSLDCLTAGIPVLQEKPIAHTVSEAERLVRAAAATPDVPVGICFQNRYNATAARMHELITSGQLGEVRGASAILTWHRTPEYYAARPWRGTRVRSGGGLLINQAIHTIDLLLWLLGDAVTVDGRASRRLLEDIDVEDTADLAITHSSGARSVLFATSSHVVDSPVTIEVITDQATLFLRDGLTVRYADGRTETAAERQASSAGRSYWGFSHELLIRDFYAQLPRREPFWISPTEAIKSLTVIDQVYAASEF